jgi:hypothetical protein
VLVGALVVLLVLLLTLPGGGPSRSRRVVTRPARASALRARRYRSSTQLAVRRFLGPDGVESSWVIAQNKLPGTTAWEITTPQSPEGIMGYASAPQARAGQTVRLFVSTQAPSFHVDAYRMGYYQGKGGRLVWSSPELPGRVQPPCPVTPGINMVQCNWPAALSVRITSAWPPGAYLLKLVGSGGQQSYVPLVVWDPSSRATYVVMEAVLTWQAFNPFGGYDLYTGLPLGLSGYPYPTRSRVLSFDRPYAYGDGAASFLSNEYPLIRFMEQHGLDVTYWTDVTLATHGNLLLRHKVLISLGHDEEWSLRMREWATRARDAGVNLIFFGASPVLRKVRLEPSPLGPDMEEVNYRDPTEDPLYGKDNAEVTQNWWGQPPADDPASTLVGASYDGFNVVSHAPMVVVDASSWLFAGTGLSDGSKIPNVLFTDFDAYNPSRPNPPDVEILTHSPVTISFDGASSWADTTYYTWRPSGAGVFESGTNNWIPALAPCTPATGNPAPGACPAQILRKMTGNLLRVFGQGPAGRLYPSTANWQAFYG